MAFTRNVTDHLEAVREAHLGNFAERRVRLLGCRGINARAHATLLGRGLKCRRCVARLERVSRLGNQLIDRRHRRPSLPSFPGKARNKPFASPLCIYLADKNSSASFRACRPALRTQVSAGAVCTFSTRKTKSRHPPDCGRALLRSDSRAAVKHRGCSLAISDRCCQRQRLSFIRRGYVPAKL